MLQRNACTELGRENIHCSSQLEDFGARGILRAEVCIKVSVFKGGGIVQSYYLAVEQKSAFLRKTRCTSILLPLVLSGRSLKSDRRLFFSQCGIEVGKKLRLKWTDFSS